MAKDISQQECIPVGCVPSAAVAACLGGVYLNACWDTHTPHLGLDPPWVWTWRPPPSQTATPHLPTGMGLKTLRDLQSPPGMGLETPPPNRMTDTCKNITFATCNTCKNITSPALIDILNDIFQNKRSQSFPFICVVSSCPPYLHYILHTHSLRCLCH